MLKREDLLELTRRMTPARSSIDRVAGAYFDEEGYIDGTFNIHFLNLSASEKTRNLKIAKTVPFSETNRQLVEMNFPGKARNSKDMHRLLAAVMEAGLKNDALMETFYEVVGEKQPKGLPFSVFVFHGIYDIPLKGTDKAEQHESEEIYEYLICTLAPVYEDYKVGEPYCGFLYPSFKNRSSDPFHIAVYEQKPDSGGAELREALGLSE